MRKVSEGERKMEGWMNQGRISDAHEEEAKSTNPNTILIKIKKVPKDMNI
jgi:hypothetical protein